MEEKIISGDTRKMWDKYIEKNTPEKYKNNPFIEATRNFIFNSIVNRPQLDLLPLTDQQKEELGHMPKSILYGLKEAEEFYNKNHHKWDNVSGKTKNEKHERKKR